MLRRVGGLCVPGGIVWVLMIVIIVCWHWFWLLWPWLGCYVPVCFVWTCEQVNDDGKTRMGRLKNQNRWGSQYRRRFKTGIWEKAMYYKSYFLDLVRFSWWRGTSIEVAEKIFKIIWCRTWPPLALLRIRLGPAISIIQHGERFLGNDGELSTGFGFLDGRWQL